MAVLVKTVLPERCKFIFPDDLIPHNESLIDGRHDRQLFLDQKSLHTSRASPCSMRSKDHLR